MSTHNPQPTTHNSNPHGIFMQRCLQLAEMGAGRVAPNPMVGAVLVHEGRIIGEGYHEFFGGPHAEVNCLASVSDKHKAFIRNATLYVSLEPCAHHGKTPPCALRILEEAIPEVVVACRDPFPLVDGKGLEILEKGGVHVVTGVLKEEAIRLNRRFFKLHQEGRPYIILKWAESNDGNIAHGDRSPMVISGPITNRLVHRWRSEESAILVGAGTVESDNPRLTNRYGSGKQPIRIVLDAMLQLPFSAAVYNEDAPTIVINQKLQDDMGRLHYLKVADTKNLGDVLTALGQLGINSILVEGGRQVLESFMRAGYVDEIRRIVSADVQIPGGFAAPTMAHYNWTLLKTECWGKDRVEYYRL